MQFGVLRRYGIRSDQIGSDRARSDRIGSDLIGSDRVGLDWIGLDRIGANWVGLEWIGLGWIGLDLRRVAVDGIRGGPMRSRWACWVAEAVIR